MDISAMDISQPLKPAVIHILLALADEERHGYAIMQAVREQSGGAVPLRTGAFYRHLSQLIESGMVAESSSRRPGDDPRRGAYYKLTPRGRDALSAERARLVDLLATFPGGRRAARKSHV